MSDASKFHKEQVVVVTLVKHDSPYPDGYVLGGFDLPGKGSRILVSKKIPTRDMPVLIKTDPKTVMYQGRVTGKLVLPDKTGVCVDIPGYGEIMVWNLEALRHDTAYSVWNDAHVQD